MINFGEHSYSDPLPAISCRCEALSNAANLFKFFFVTTKNCDTIYMQSYACQAHLVKSEATRVKGESEKVKVLSGLVDKARLSPPPFTYDENVLF
jgi:hypothetical protein